MFGSEQPVKLDFDRINARMSKEPIKKALAHLEVGSAQDLMWYYALSRREAVAISADALMNTDTNLLTEVRLSRLIEVPDGAENPYTYLLDGFKYDLDPYMPEAELVQRYYNSGLFFLQWDTPKVARLVVKQLESRDERLARSLKYETYLYDERIDEAIKFYGEHEHWTDRVHVRQSEIWALQGQFDPAQQAVSRVESPLQKDMAQARLLFYRKDFRQLSELKSSFVEARKWKLLGLAQSDLMRAGSELDKLELDADRDLPLLRVMVGYYGAIHDIEKTQRFAQRLSAELDAQARRLNDLAWEAMEEKEFDHVEFLIDRMEKNNSNADGVAKLKSRLKKMREEQTATQDAPVS